MKGGWLAEILIGFMLGLGPGLGLGPVIQVYDACFWIKVPVLAPALALALALGRPTKKTGNLSATGLL